MISHHDPEKPKMQEAQKIQFDLYWRNGWLGDATYVRSLVFLGYAPNDASTELNLLKLDGKIARDPSVA